MSGIFNLIICRFEQGLYFYRNKVVDPKLHLHKSLHSRQIRVAKRLEYLQHFNFNIENF